MSDINWDGVANTAAEVVKLLAPVAEAAVPGAAEAIAIGTKIIHGVIDAEPTAVALYEQIKSGVPPTVTQIKALNDAYEASYQTLRAKLAEQIAALP